MRLPANSIYSQHIFYFWWLESDLVVFRGILFKGAQYSLYIPEQLIVLVLLLHQKIHKYNNMSNVLCFRRDKRFTGDGECCFLRQFQLLMWLWGKAISGRVEWMKSRVLGRGLNLPCHIQRRATNKQGNESSFPPQDRHFFPVNSFMYELGIYAICAVEEMALLTDLLGPNTESYALARCVVGSSWISPLPGRMAFLIGRGHTVLTSGEACLLVLGALRESLPLTRTAFHLRDRSTFQHWCPLESSIPIPARKTGWIHEAQSECGQTFPAHPTTGLGAVDTRSGFEI